MLRFRVTLGSWLLLAACAGAAVRGSSVLRQAQDERSPPGASAVLAEDFSLRDSEGRTVHLSDFSGQVVLLDFWQTWCVPCAAELPLLQRIYETYKDKGFAVLAISMDGPETVAQVAPFVQRLGLTFPALLDEETKVTGLYNPARSAPLSILIDRKGRVFRTREGFEVGDEKLIEADVQTLIGQ